MDIANAALVQIASRGMMDRMCAPPDIVWRKRQDTDCPPGPVCKRSAAEITAMATIVLDHEETDQKTCIQDRDGEGQPTADRHRPPGDGPEAEEGNDADQKLVSAAQRVGVTIGRQDADPVLWVCSDGRLLWHAVHSCGIGPSEVSFWLPPCAATSNFHRFRRVGRGRRVYSNPPPCNVGSVVCRVAGRRKPSG